MANKDTDSTRKPDAQELAFKNNVLETVLASINYINSHIAQTERMRDGIPIEASPLEQTCRAIAQQMTTIFNVPCAVGVKKQRGEGDAVTYAADDRLDNDWRNLAEVILRQGPQFTHTPILAEREQRSSPQLYICKEITPTDSFEGAFLNRIIPFLATAIDNAYHFDRNLDAQKSLTRKLRDQKLGDNYHLADVSVLPPFFNKDSGQMLLDEILARAMVEGKDVSIAMLDIDRFKWYNDTYGHLQGDRAIRTTGHVIYENIEHVQPHDFRIYPAYLDNPSKSQREEHAKTCRSWKNEVVANLLQHPGDFLIRHGAGEEFVAVFYGANVKQAERIGQRLRERVSTATIPVPADVANRDAHYRTITWNRGPNEYASGVIVPGDEQVIQRFGPAQLTISVGIAGTDGRQPRALALIKEADAALYEAKRSRDSLAVFDSTRMKPREQ